MSQNLSFDVDLPLAFNDAVGRVKEALKQEGFGILTEIDLRAAFHEKLGREFRPYAILGAATRRSHSRQSARIPRLDCSCRAT